MWGVGLGLGGGGEEADVNMYPAVFLKNIILSCIIVMSRPHIVQGGLCCVDVLLHVHKRPSEKHREFLGTLKTPAAARSER